MTRTRPPSSGTAAPKPSPRTAPNSPHQQRLLATLPDRHPHAAARSPPDTLATCRRCRAIRRGSSGRREGEARDREKAVDMPRPWTVGTTPERAAPTAHSRLDNPGAGLPTCPQPLRRPRRFAFRTPGPPETTSPVTSLSGGGGRHPVGRTCAPANALEEVMPATISRPHADHLTWLPPDPARG